MAGSEKPCDLSQIDPEALWELGNVAKFGNSKYPRLSWFEEPGVYSDYYAAAQRHMMAWYSGYDLDGESGRSHLMHAAWNLMAIYTFQIRRIGTDDRVFKRRKK